MNITLPVKENLVLKTLNIEDAQIYFDTAKNNNVHLREWLGWLDDDKSVEDTKAYIEDSNKRLSNKEGLDLSIWFEGQLVGGIGFFPFDMANKKTSVAYWLTKESQGKGIMISSLRVAINYVFKEVNMNRIEITCAIENTKSSALPKKLGFTFEGVAREGGWLYDHFVNLEVYSLLSKEWKS